MRQIYSAALLRPTSLTASSGRLLTGQLSHRLSETRAVPRAAFAQAAAASARCVSSDARPVVETQTASTSTRAATAATVAAAAVDPVGLAVTLREPLPPRTGNRIVDELHAALWRYPLTTSLVYLYHNGAYAGILYAGLWLAGVPAPSELGMAFMINRLTRRFRIPLILALSALVVRVRPVYGKLQLTKLMTMPLASLKDQVEAADAAAAGSQAGAASPTSRMATPSTADEQPMTPLQAKVGRGVLKAVDMMNMGGLLDKYGLAYVLCGRAVSTVSILSIYWLLSTGTDVSWMMEYVGEAGETVSAWTARWAEACIALNLVYPLVLRYGVADASLGIGRVVEKLQADAAALEAAEAEAAAAAAAAKPHTPDKTTT
ncbi:hypothetical protein EON66_01520 [archaeon]|nr:MAG: hypothetical protein EON66_01520 [archaeon]